MKNKLLTLILSIICLVTTLIAVISIKDVTNGKDGTSIISSVINEKGELELTYSNGTTVNLGKITGTDGINGTDGLTPYIGAKRKLVLRLNRHRPFFARTKRAIPQHIHQSKQSLGNQRRRN